VYIRNGKKNARLRLIFDNGTEGNLLRSLATELYKDPNGRRITSTNMGPLFEDRPQEGETQTGMIYVVKSLSNDPKSASWMACSTKSVSPREKCKSAFRTRKMIRHS
jgi:hypothetical protein